MNTLLGTNKTTTQPTQTLRTASRLISLHTKPAYFTFRSNADLKELFAGGKPSEIAEAISYYRLF